MPEMQCRICGGTSAPFGVALILSKHQVPYYRCQLCGFIQTAAPYWLAEAYSDAISRIDVGIMQRNIQNAAITAAVISVLFRDSRRFLDYGGGYGTLVRMMRDAGFDFRWWDSYAKNLHAAGFEHVDGERYDLLTAYEVLEHLPDPLADMARMLQLSDNVLTTTVLAPEPPPAPPDWWYYAVNGGQHISFYSAVTLQRMASHFGLHLLSSGYYHLFTREPKSRLLFRIATSRKTARAVNRVRQRPSLTEADFRQMGG